MDLPAQPVTFSVAQIEELSQHFSFFRHDVNNSVGMIGAAAELLRYSPEAARRWSSTVIEQPPRIAGKTREFVNEVRRTAGVRKAEEPSWYRDLWPRTNAGPSEIPGAVSLPAESVRAIFLELIQLHKELSLLAFAVSGTETMSGSAETPEMAAGASEQVGKVARKFNQFAELLEGKLGLKAVPHRLLTGIPTSSVTLSPEQLSLLDRRLTNLERDIHGHLQPLLELSRLARVSPDQLQTRAPELASHAPRISAEIQKFSGEFDAAFGIRRAG